jgi:hypothetical protein
MLGKIAQFQTPLYGSSLQPFTKHDLAKADYDKLIIHPHGISQKKQALAIAASPPFCSRPS